MADYYTLLTTIGAARLANAHATRTPVNFAQIAVGDAEYAPGEGQAALVNEVWRGAINDMRVHADNPNWFVIETVIPEDVGGWFVREVGLFDDAGNLIAVGKYPSTYKPVLASGSARDILIRMILEVGNTADVSLSIDPSIVLATRNYVDTALSEHDAAEDAHADATTETKGFVELATIPETRAGTDASRAVTPVDLAAIVAAMKKTDLLNSLLDAMYESTALRVLDARADPFIDLSHIDAGLSFGYAHDAGNALITNSGGPTQTIYDAAGTYTFVVPEGNTEIGVKIFGGGGGAGGFSWNTSPGGGGGGGGYTSLAALAVTPGDEITVTVGAGGNGGYGATNGADGETSSFGAHGSAGGGGGGTYGVYGGFGTGGPAGIGTTENGEAGNTSASTAVAAWGGAAGGTAYGGGARSIGPTEPGDGNPGNSYGGGGSSGWNSAADRYGGDGADGAVVIDWVGAYEDIAAVTTVLEATAIPTVGYMLGIVEPIDALDYEAGDIVLKMSVGDAVSWEAMAVSKVGETEDGHDVVFGEVVFAAPADTTVRAGFGTANGKQVKFHGIIADAEA